MVRKETIETLWKISSHSWKKTTRLRYDSIQNISYAREGPERKAFLGEEWTINQTKELLKGGAPCLHFYTMSKVDGFVRIAKEVL